MKGIIRTIILAAVVLLLVLHSRWGGFTQSSSSKTVSAPEDRLVLVNKSQGLPEKYIPGDLVLPKVSFAPGSSKSNSLMRKEASEALEAMFKTAQGEGIVLYGVSGYRSYDYQDKLFDSRAKAQGITETSKYVAEPGHSEHQTGLAIDVTNKKGLNGSLGASFGETKEGKWLAKNAQRFGFIIRYSKGKEEITGYAYEPWHVRYVGIEAAKEITGKKLTLEEYLGKSL